MVGQTKKSHEQMQETLKRHGLRATPQRLQIAMRVLLTHDHFTAEDVITWSSKQRTRLSRATIYNTLNEFVAVGLLKSFYSAIDEKLIFDSNTSQHFHFLDTETNQLFDISPSSCLINTQELIGYQIEETEVLFRGRKLTETKATKV